jgi:hypothetical protein
MGPASIFPVEYRPVCTIPYDLSPQFQIALSLNVPPSGRLRTICRAKPGAVVAETARQAGGYWLTPLRALARGYTLELRKPPD